MMRLAERVAYHEAMILEGLVTTLDPDGSPHLAPMGPRVEGDFARFTLRPFPTSNTYQNLLPTPAKACCT